MEERDAVARELTQLRYQDAYITVDNADGYMDQRFRNAPRRGQKVHLDRLRGVYIEALWDPIEFYDRLALRVLGRSPKHVLLLHENDLAALFVGDLIRHVRAQGWKIISPEEAYADPASHLKLDTLKNRAGRIAAWASARGYRGPVRDRYQDRLVADALLKGRRVFR